MDPYHFFYLDAIMVFTIKLTNKIISHSVRISDKMAHRINKDIKVSNLFQLKGPKVQVKHLDHLFRIYIKSMGKETVYRVEESLHPKR
jgi:hypothetical protein